MSQNHSVVMLDNDAVDNLLLDPFLLAFLELSLTIRGCPAFAPDLSGRCVLIVDATFDAIILEHRTARHWYQAHVVIRNGEVERPESCVVVLVWRWLDDSMDGSLVKAAREEL